MSNNLNDDNLDWLDDDIGDEQSSNRTIEPTQRELLTLKLLRSAIHTQNPDDAVMQDFAEYVLPNLLKITIGVTAKGGKFFDKLDQEKGKENVRRDNAADQSLNTHLLNGLFPANLIEQRLEQLDTTIQRLVREQERRLVMAAFILHDFEKFPDVDGEIRSLPGEERLKQHRQVIDKKIQQLGLDHFINPQNPTAYREYLDDLLCMAYNAQRRWDTNWNFSEYGLQPVLKDKILRNLTELTCLADSLASIIKHPQDATSYKFKELLHSLSDGQISLTYHSISENRGVLTNVVNNAVMDAHIALNTPDKKHYEPLLYLPTGVIYLAYGKPPPVALNDLPERVIAKIKQLCFEQLRRRQTGFSRDGKGMKYADYYTLFCDTRQLMYIALDATLRILSNNKKSVGPSRSAKLKTFQEKGALSADYDFQLGDDIRIDQLAEFGDVICRKVWGERCDLIQTLYKERTKKRKKNKDLSELPELKLLPEQLVIKLAEFLGLSEYLPQLREIQTINATLKEKKVKGSTGGIPYEWYFISTKLIQGSGIENIREIAEKIIDHAANLIEPVIAQYEVADGWDDLRSWVNQVVMLPQATITKTPKDQTDIFLKELASYQVAKKVGRGKLAICSVSHSAYSVKEQMESEVLFTPQVYTNKQLLGGSNAKRNISSIAGLEMMLRQILMNQTQAVGKRFEDGKYRYLYFYPTYYFTPETSRFLQKAYTGIAQTRFSTNLRNHFISKDLVVDFSREHYQAVDSFLIDDDLERKTTLPEDDPDYKRDRTFKLSYPDDQPLTFFFMALPPGRDPTDTESWVMPAWLAFASPMILDVKTVVSESPVPPFNDGAEFEESVFLDSAPQAFRALLKQDRFRLDYILEGWQTPDGTQQASPLNALTSAYAIHLDVNAKQGKGGYDANWGKLTELAKDLETSPLYVFNYLNRWLRNQKKESIRIEKIKLYAYHFYPCFDPHTKLIVLDLEEMLVCDEKSALRHPQRLTELYRRFYRADKRYNPKSNAVLKPIKEAADVILNADTDGFRGEDLVFLVAAKNTKLMDRIHSSGAEGYPVFKRNERDQERESILEFARYFVHEVFEKSFASDRGRLAGRQLNLLRDACEFIYRLEQDKENKKDKDKADSKQIKNDVNSSNDNGED